ncbi:MAG: ABC transporter ATP-binding protein [Flavobacteriia bacterium]|nr:ABC transporter ATP-binding protein [Flavobacteriia bacterium]OJX36924.1 MAG: hypothetical protein BGO87_14165 [Flavobacteriia bacterium 40-80]
MKEVAIKLERVAKKYTIGKEKDSSLRGTVSGLFSKNSSKSEDFWALKNVSFEIEKGDVVGIIGRNGAGKSTLLKILSQITRPTEGKIEINGRIASLLEVGTGFHPELTGRENIFLNGTILGMSRKEVAAKFDEIVAFSGIEKFIDTPVKHYSSGMYVRLAFAVAAHLEPEILIIDEVLAVGDAEFQKKCLGKMKDVAGEGRTVLFVSHNMQAVNLLCNRGIVLSAGEVIFNGDCIEAINKYNNLHQQLQNSWTGNEGDEDVRLIRTCINNETDYFFNDQDIDIEIEINILNEVKNLVVGFHLFNDFDEPIAYTVAGDYEKRSYSLGSNIIKFRIPGYTLTKGNYFVKIDLGIHDLRFITKDIGNLSFNVIIRDNIGCVYPVSDVHSYTGIFRPNWEHKA